MPPANRRNGSKSLGRRGGGVVLAESCGCPASHHVTSRNPTELTDSRTALDFASLRLVRLSVSCPASAGKADAASSIATARLHSASRRRHRRAPPRRACAGLAQPGGAHHLPARGGRGNRRDCPHRRRPAVGDLGPASRGRGASGNIAAEFVARSDPDGYTIYLATFPHATNRYLYSSLGYDPVADF